MGYDEQFCHMDEGPMNVNYESSAYVNEKQSTTINNETLSSSPLLWSPLEIPISDKEENQCYVDLPRTFALQNTSSIQSTNNIGDFPQNIQQNLLNASDSVLLNKEMDIDQQLSQVLVEEPLSWGEQMEKGAGEMVDGFMFGVGLAVGAAQALWDNTFGVLEDIYYIYDNKDAILEELQDPELQEEFKKIIADTFEKIPNINPAEAIEALESGIKQEIEATVDDFESKTAYEKGMLLGRFFSLKKAKQKLIQKLTSLAHKSPKIRAFLKKMGISDNLNDDSSSETSTQNGLPNTLHHIFGKESHNLDILLEKYGDPQSAFDAVKRATENALDKGLLKPNKNGVLPTGDLGPIIDVDGIQVRLIGGRILDGELHISSFSRRDLE